ncbi:hypothetical protein CDCA_CDCA10G2872 [Cyanidium caldarium]|uniref:TTI1 N-terminal TPR domain-containing protein n=1 Tax=Cyanidium caldarium TaxID=2771 RepID=A0AAV9IX24_CYACA|nr:hypothetical protein CDCA_CDCA10G2872 [Cyanidium caldarium]
MNASSPADADHTCPLTPAGVARLFHEARQSRATDPPSDNSLPLHHAAAQVLLLRHATDAQETEASCRALCHFIEEISRGHDLMSSSGDDHQSHSLQYLVKATWAALAVALSREGYLGGDAELQLARLVVTLCDGRPRDAFRGEAAMPHAPLQAATRSALHDASVSMVAVTISRLVDMFRGKRQHPPLRQQALEALGALVPCLDVPTLARFLPGIASALAHVLIGDASIGKQVSIAASDCWGAVLQARFALAMSVTPATDDSADTTAPFAERVRHAGAPKVSAVSPLLPAATEEAARLLTLLQRIYGPDAGHFSSLRHAAPAARCAAATTCATVLRALAPVSGLEAAPSVLLPALAELAADRDADVSVHTIRMFRSLEQNAARRELEACLEKLLTGVDRARGVQRLEGMLELLTAAAAAADRHESLSAMRSFFLERPEAMSRLLYMVSMSGDRAPAADTGADDSVLREGVIIARLLVRTQCLDLVAEQALPQLLAANATARAHCPAMLCFLNELMRAAVDASGDHTPSSCAEAIGFCADTLQAYTQLEGEWSHRPTLALCALDGMTVVAESGRIAVDEYRRRFLYAQLVPVLGCAAREGAASVAAHRALEAMAHAGGYPSAAVMVRARLSGIAAQAASPMLLSQVMRMVGEGAALLLEDKIQYTVHAMLFEEDVEAERSFALLQAAGTALAADFQHASNGGADGRPDHGEDAARMRIVEDIFQAARNACHRSSVTVRCEAIRLMCQVMVGLAGQEKRVLPFIAQALDAIPAALHGAPARALTPCVELITVAFRTASWFAQSRTELLWRALLTYLPLHGSTPATVRQRAPPRTTRPAASAAIRWNAVADVCQLLSALPPAALSKIALEAEPLIDDVVRQLDAMRETTPTQSRARDQALALLNKLHAASEGACNRE